MVEGDASAPPTPSRSKGAAGERSVTALAFISTQLSLVKESAPVLLQVLAAAHKGTACSPRDGRNELGLMHLHIVGKELDKLTLFFLVL